MSGSGAQPLPRGAERIAARGQVPLLLSSEHAGKALPAPWSWPEADRWVVETHWCYDLGAAELTRELAAALGCGAILSTFSRLLIDPNRDQDSDTLIRSQADERPLTLNAAVDADERARRLAYYRGYHQALRQACRDRAGETLLALHSFTPCYQGERRDHIEIGVLFDREDALAEALASWLGAVSDKVLLNEPYSGKRGMIFAASHHAEAAGMKAIELELRQDLAVDPAFRGRLVERLASFAW